MHSELMPPGRTVIQKSATINSHQANSSVLMDLQKDSDILTVFFSGMLEGQYKHIFSFRGMTKEWLINKIYVRDNYNLWYHSSFEGSGKGIEGLASFIKSKIRQENFNKVYLVGSSMGGYAAIIIGSLINANGVLAFNPQTCLKPLWLLMHYDRRYWRLMMQIYTSKEKNPQLYCLRKVLSNYMPNQDIDIHVSLDRLDKAHANHIKDFERVNVITHPVYNHNLPAALKQSGELESVLKQFIDLNG